MRPLIAALALSVLCAGVAHSQTPDPASLVKQGRAHMTEGRLAEAAKLFGQAVTLDSRSFDAQLAMGTVLDLQGHYVEARRHLAEAINYAPVGPARNQAMTAMAISYIFESKTAEAVKYLTPIHTQQLFAKDLGGAAGTANAIGRIHVEAGDAANARQWYVRGYEHAKQIEGLQTAERDLWELRYLHALARIAARDGKPEEARKQLAAFEQVMNRRAMLADDNEIYRYLAGYVAYYAKDHDRAIAELSKGNQADPFIVHLLAMAYEAKGDAASAQQQYRRTLELNTHSLNNAFSRPHALTRVKPGPPASLQLR
jgi:Flp pilus assembly protein TadD